VVNYLKKTAKRPAKKTVKKTVKPKRKIHKGPQGGKYYVTKGRKVYV
jgi:hypothetical protein